MEWDVLLLIISKKLIILRPNGTAFFKYIKLYFQHSEDLDLSKCHDEP